MRESISGRIWQICALLWHVACVACDEYMLSEQLGIVSANDNVYYTLRSDGFVKIQLEPVTGDVDLYVSFSVQRPNYLEYDFKSTSCGVDEVFVSRRQPRPVYIGVHATDAQNATYVIRTYRMTHLIPPYEELTHEDLLSAHYMDDSTKPTNANQDAVHDDSDTHSSGDSRSVIFDIIIWLLKILFEVLA